MNKRAHKFFALLFYDSSSREAPLELPWKDFIAAMANAGFRAEKMYLSMWQFTPNGQSMGIQLRKPWPHGKMTPVIARQIRRTLEHHYGWTSETFVRVQPVEKPSLRRLVGLELCGNRTAGEDLLGWVKRLSVATEVE